MIFSRIYAWCPYLTSVTDDFKFYTVVFDEDYAFCRVYDNHCTLAEGFQLVESLDIYT